MAKVAFQGPEHIRILASEDLKKAGVEGFTKTSFNRHEPAEVSAEAAKALTERGDLFGNFTTVEEDDSENQLDIPTETKSTSKATKSGAANTSADGVNATAQ